MTSYVVMESATDPGGEPEFVRDRFSVLAASLHAELAEVDVNPVIAGPRGVTAVDVLLVRRERV